MRTSTDKTSVLLPHWLDGKNIYMEELGNAYRRAGCELIYGADNLFEVTVNADIVHLHWPEAFYRWTGHGSIEERTRRFIEAVDGYKKQGSRIVWTVHNLTPHDHVTRGIDYDVYQAIAQRTDLFHHHCPCSIKALAETYTIPEQALSLVAPHGHYLSYPTGISTQQARQRLNIPDDAYVYLHFGAIRSYKGLDALFSAFRNVQHKNKWLLVAGNYQGMSGKGAWRDRLQMAWAERMASRITLHLQSVPSEDIQTFFAASDALVLSHSRGLNSGVAVLGMTFGKLLIGPQLGCIEWVLNQGNNLTFPANSHTGLVDAMTQAADMDNKAVFGTNSALAASWTWDNIVTGVLNHSALALHHVPGSAPDKQG